MPKYVFSLLQIGKYLNYRSVKLAPNFPKLYKQKLVLHGKSFGNIVNNWQDRHFQDDIDRDTQENQTAVMTTLIAHSNASTVTTGSCGRNQTRPACTRARFNSE